MVILNNYFPVKFVDLNQAQVIDQLENLAQSNGLRVYKTPSEEEPTTVNAFLSTDDFYFDISVKITGEISDAKFSIFSEPAMVNFTNKYFLLLDF